jgi:aminomethyltransferase
VNDSAQLKTTPLTAWHEAHGGRMVPFAGFSMPVQYTSVLAEHDAVREKVGLFDITHMGEVYVTGSPAGAWISSLVTNKTADIPDGKIVYTAMCREDGGVLDDMLIYHLAGERWLIVMNASNHDKIAAWLRAHVPPTGVVLDDASDRTALIAVQGPHARDLMDRLDALQGRAADVAALDFYTHFLLPRPGGEWIVSRTGYTGEHGYELYLPNADALAVWEELLAKGADLGVAPIGLAARDTLRFEACYCLYGHELNESWTPLEAGINWAVKLKKDGGFLGRDALVAQKDAGVPRKLIGLEVEGKAIARQDMVVLHGEHPVGLVTSGTFSPTLKRSLALALVNSEIPDGAMAVEIRGKRMPAHTVPLPFLAARVKGDPQAERTLA